MEVASSFDFVDPETWPLQILLSEDVFLAEDGKDQNAVGTKAEENHRLRIENFLLKQEKIFWRKRAEKERGTASVGSISLRSRVTEWSETMYSPDSEGMSWKCYKSKCPCCRRPLEITISSVKEEPWTSYVRGSRYAFVTALWGANAGYAFGAVVLGWRLRDLSPGIERVMVHTDDVPNNYLDVFEKDGLWKLRSVDYIDGVSSLYWSKGNIFDGVFTKLAAWKLVEYAKMLLLDLDVIPLKPLDVELPLRVVLLQHILTTMLERAQKINACSKKDQLWVASLKSNLILEDCSWPYLVWNSQSKTLEIQPKKKAISMEDMLTELQEIITMCSKEKAIVRFHSLKSQQGQDQVFPWRLDVDLKSPILHQSFTTLPGNSVWQLVVIRMRARSQSQSKLADLLAQQLKPLQRSRK